MACTELIGTWRLRSYRLIGARGRLLYPLGEAPSGYLLYSPDGYMAVSMMSAGRQPFSSDEVRRGTEEEAARAARTYLSYAGWYEIEGNRVVHHVEVSLFPNWTRTRQERFYRLQGERLELSTAPFNEDGSGPRAHLVWEKVTR